LSPSIFRATRHAPQSSSFFLLGNSYNIAAMTREIPNLDLTLGPLHYHLQAHDDWATELLGRLADRVACARFSGPVHRHVHVVRQPLGHIADEAFAAGNLPPELVALVPEELPLQGWQISGDDVRHITWRHADTHHVFWLESCGETTPALSFPCPFHLPLDLLFYDIVQLGGGIVHGGLAVYHGQGVLLTAPPGGGKTTAFSTTPESWLLLSDDAALVWPDAKGAFHISPLPTWSVLLGVNPQLERIVQWQVGTSRPLAGILFLEKADAIALTRQHPIDAAFPLYRAFSEYPAVIIGRTPHRIALFKAASALARTLPAWSLQLTHKGNFWPRLEEELNRGRG
jgi:hypothetical protein